MVQTKTVCERCIEIIGLSCNLHLLVRTHAAESTHVMKTVSKLDQQGTDIILHGSKYLTEIIYLLGMHIVILLLLGNNAYKESHLVAEALPDVIYCERSILNHIMKECRNHRIGTQFKLFRHDARNIDRMNYIWFT